MMAKKQANKVQIYPLKRFSKFVIDNVWRFNSGDLNVSTYIDTGIALIDSTIKNINEIQSEDVAALALGDLGMFASSLAYREISLEKMQGLLCALTNLGTVTGLPPRDNYYSYTELNPPGYAARTYLGSIEEKRLIVLNRMFRHHFYIIQKNIKALITGPSWNTYEQLINAHSAFTSTRNIIRLMLSVRQEISPEFYFNFRKFSKPFLVPGSKWEGPDGKITEFVPKLDFADSNITIIDILLYGIDDVYKNHLKAVHPHFPNAKKQIISVISKLPCLSDRFSNETGAHKVKDLVIQVYKNLWIWRSSHNEGVTSHLRKYNKGLLDDKKSFEYDEKLKYFIERSKEHYTKLLTR